LADTPSVYAFLSFTPSLHVTEYSRVGRRRPPRTYFRAHFSAHSPGRPITGAAELHRQSLSLFWAALCSQRPHRQTDLHAHCCQWQRRGQQRSGQEPCVLTIVAAVGGRECSHPVHSALRWIMLPRSGPRPFDLPAVSFSITTVFLVTATCHPQYSIHVHHTAMCHRTAIHVQWSMSMFQLPTIDNTIVL
jgi:hypothetical protein